MAQHVVLVQNFGWDEEKEVFTFDANRYTEDEVMDGFDEFEGITENGYPFTGYEYDGERFYSVSYLGVFPDDEIPCCEHDLMMALLGD